MKQFLSFFILYTPTNSLSVCLAPLASRYTNRVAAELDSKDLHFDLLR